MSYLLKVTIAWSLFLLLFEALYKSNGKFAANRLYLLLGIAAGLLLPLIQLPLHVHAILTATQDIYAAATATRDHPAITGAVAASPHPAAYAIDSWKIAGALYSIGFILIAFKCGLELFRIQRLIRHGERQVIGGRSVIVTHLIHAPYSFMRWIFIPDPAGCTAQELDCIIRHEAVHHLKWHWLDLMLVQAICMVLWFHPLVWRFRYLLRLQHEYEADSLAAGDDAYGYGHFLLEQTLLSGVPSIAHSFNSSPIKNRIYMLTKRQKGKAGSWKYILLLPALTTCTFLMAGTGTGEMQQGRVTTYKGNTFTWRETDTLYYDRLNREAIKTGAAGRRSIISDMNGETVFRNELLQAPASYGGYNWDYADYVSREFKARIKGALDSVTTVEVSSVVVNKEGKVVYCELQFFRPYYKYLYFKAMQKDWHPDGKLNGIIDRIISESPRWQPATREGQPVNSVVTFLHRGC